jgi:hypothetical protein
LTGPTTPVPLYPSKPLAKIDRRRIEYRILREVREALVKHCGGNPSPTQAVIIERVAWLSLRCSQIDRKVIEGTLTDYDAKSALAWSPAIQRSCKLLGLQSTDAEPPSLADVLRDGDAA